MDKLFLFLDKAINSSLINCVISNKKNKLANIDKVKIRQVIMKDQYLFQVTEYVGTKVIHQNLDGDKTKEYIAHNLQHNFKQCQIQCESFTASILVSNKGQITIKEKGAKFTLDSNSLNHNRTKEYLIQEGNPIPFLVDLGVMNKDGFIIKSKYDKFKQINRFLEFIHDIMPKLSKDKKITILDFGCGKSYLTFAMYYYLKEMNNFDLNIIGLDLKEDVINKCNSLSKKYGYDDLHFYKGDVADYEGVSKVDMVVTLHACDTATDYALAKAVIWDADVILSVPCCQHEVNKQISNDLFNPILQYGILKDRMSALITDGLRANILNASGYDTQLLEFIDMEHTPKNILIRAVKSAVRTKPDDNYKKLIDELNIKHTLYELLKERGIIQ